MANIRFEYLYRDAGNFKNWGEVIFSNPNNIGVDLLSSMAESASIENTYFIADKANIPDLHFEKFNQQLDHDWHEIYALSSTEEIPNDLLDRNIEEFIKSIAVSASK